MTTERAPFDDVSKLDVEFRGYPITIIGSGLSDLLPAVDGESVREILLDILRNAYDLAEPGEPSGWHFESHFLGQRVWIERFGGVRSEDRHDGGQWSIYLPADR
jgi:hypothetical protein